MKKVKLEKPPLLRALFYGDSGSGKTTLIGSAMECPETRPIMILDAGGQSVSLRNLDPPPLVFAIESMEDFNEPYAWITSGQVRDETKSAFQAEVAIYLDRWGFDKFQSVALDSVTHIQGLALDKITGSTGTLPGGMPKSALRQHWGDALRQMTNLVKLYYKLPVHVFMTALTKWTELVDMGTTLFSPSLAGQSALLVPSFAEILGRLIPLEGLNTQQVNVLSKAYPKEWAGAYNILLLRGGRNFLAKWQGLAKPIELLLAPTVSQLVAKLNESGDS